MLANSLAFLCLENGRHVNMVSPHFIAYEFSFLIVRERQEKFHRLIKWKIMLFFFNLGQKYHSVQP